MSSIVGVVVGIPQHHEFKVQKEVVMIRFFFIWIVAYYLLVFV